MPRTELTLEELVEVEDLDLGTSEWIEVTQERIDQFADATGDHQWIHVDPERAADGPFGGTIAHGYLTVALIPSLFQTLFRVSDSEMGINYGIDKLRLTAPVPSGSRVRLDATLSRAEQRGDGVRYWVDCTVETDGEERPALIGTVVYMALGG